MPALRSFIDQARRFGFKDSALANGYGMAETTLGVAFTPLGKGIQVEAVDRDVLYDKKIAAITEPETPASKEVVIAGPPVPGMELRIVDDDGRDLPPRHVGEISVRGDAVTEAYLTKDGPLPATDEAGWLRTGDIGYVTEDGCLAICGRSKNVIIFGGRNIFPGDLELLVESISGVRKGSVLALGVELEAFGRKGAQDDDVEVAKVYEKAGAKVSELDAKTVGKWRDIARETAWKDYAAKTPTAAKLLKLASDVSA